MNHVRNASRVVEHVGDRLLGGMIHMKTTTCMMKMNPSSVPAVDKAASVATVGPTANLPTTHPNAGTPSVRRCTSIIHRETFLKLLENGIVKSSN